MYKIIEKYDENLLYNKKKEKKVLSLVLFVSAFPLITLIIQYVRTLTSESAAMSTTTFLFRIATAVIIFSLALFYHNAVHCHCINSLARHTVMKNAANKNETLTSFDIHFRWRTVVYVVNEKKYKVKAVGNHIEIKDVESNTIEKYEL